MHYEGNLTITSANADQYSNLASVGGDLSVWAEFNSPVLTSVGGNLSVRAEFNAPVLASVEGYLSVRAEFNAPALASVGGYIYVYTKFNAPALASVGGELSVEAEFNAPALASVGGELSVHTEFNAPVLTSVGGDKFTKPVLVIQTKPWVAVITDTSMQLGCQKHSHRVWAEFTDEQINQMDTDALKFWRKHKSKLIKACSDHTSGV